MTAMQALIERQRIETQALSVGQQRAGAEALMASSAECIGRLLYEATEAGISIETFAQLVGVSRQTLYRWKARPV